MAIHTKVGILTHVPGSSASVTPGLIDGIYADFLTKEYDFMDDPRMFPQDAWFTNDPWVYTNHATGDWEDIATTYRAWRDEYNKEANEYWLQRSVRTPFQYKNFVKDPSGGAGLNPLEWIRVVWPAPNGDFNIPYPNPKWSDGYSYSNSSRPLVHNMTRITLPLEDMAWQAARADGLSDILEKQTWVRDNQAAVDAKYNEWYAADGNLHQVSDFLSFIRSSEGLELAHIYSIGTYYTGVGILERSGAGGNEYRNTNMLISFFKDLDNLGTAQFYEKNSMLEVLSAVYGREFTQADVEAKLLALETYMISKNMTWRDASEINHQISHFWWISEDGTSNWDNYSNQAQSELQALYEATTRWIEPDTMSGRSSKYRANRDAFFKAMNELALGTPLSSQNPPLTEEEFATMRADFLNFDFLENSPNPWNDEAYRFAWGDGINPVEGAQNVNIHQAFGYDYGQGTMTNHPSGTMPFEVLQGVTVINQLPAISNESLLPVTGNPGDVVLDTNNGDMFAWDPQNQQWSKGFYARFIEPFAERLRSVRDAKLKAKNELSLAIRPFLFAEFYIPAFSLGSSNVIVK